MQQWLPLVISSHLSEEGDDPLGAILVHVGQIDLVTEEHQPLAQLDGSEHHSVGGAAVLAVVVEGLQQQLWGGGTGEVQTHNLRERGREREREGKREERETERETVKRKSEGQRDKEGAKI